MGTRGGDDPVATTLTILGCGLGKPGPASDATSGYQVRIHFPIAEASLGIVYRVTPGNAVPSAAEVFHNHALATFGTKAQKQVQLRFILPSHDVPSAQQPRLQQSDDRQHLVPGTSLGSTNRI
ncbi:hypothetical protein PAAG_00654 [Paracoccidioides lutzii Pb01]|uniref:Uncharacterized protein n=1 Tax=Paracoccidioides lutzii (strain ATCC MYA-826 / Pb01) TaxID=502779 RepID=C1GQ59_PARBA|nr:hypothetical protein PAAG_00654 [Paracoccidioides lutzii Pb01]EEH37733.2 hypothetical protein PAAG_00654 [Paracoccidioides lutzii Pb01]